VRYITKLADGAFKTDAEGRRVYFPNGIFGSGRIVPSDAEYERLRRRLARFIGAGMTVGPALALSLIWVPIWLVLAVGAVVVLSEVGVLIWLRRRAWSRWAVSAERLSYREVVERSPRTLASWLLLGTSLPVLAMALGLAVLARDDSHVLGVSLGVAALSAAYALFAWHRIRTLRRIRRGAG